MDPDRHTAGSGLSRVTWTQVTLERALPIGLFVMLIALTAHAQQPTPTISCASGVATYAHPSASTDTLYLYGSGSVTYPDVSCVNSSTVSMNVTRSLLSS